jgi:hypothetical protein
VTKVSYTFTPLSPRHGASSGLRTEETADSGWSSSLGVWRGLTTPTIKLKLCYETLHRDSGQDGLFGTT